MSTPARRWAAVGLGALALLVLYVLWTAKHLGAGIDQYVDQQYFINNLDGFVHNTRFPYVFYSEADANIQPSYGYTFQAIAFFVSWALASIRNEAFDPFSAATYTDKNVMIALLSLGAFWGVYHATRSLLGKRRFAAAATVLLALSPVFTGHALMNQKDLPLAVGFTCLTAGTIAVVGRLQRRTTLGGAALTRRFGTRSATGVLLALGVAFTVGARPASVVVVFLDVALMATIAVMTRAHRSWRELQSPVVGLATGTVAVLATNSAAWPNPVSWLLHAIDVSRQFPIWGGKVLVDGLYHNNDAQPRWYLPFMLAVQTPLVIAALGIVAVWYLAARVATDRRPLGAVLLWLPMVAQLLLLPLGGVLQGSLFYNAARQALFVLPMLAVLAATGLAALDHLVSGRRARIAVGCAVAVGALLPLIDTVTLYPYQYVYYGELERTADLTDRFEFDYWGISGRETQEWVNEHYPTALEAYPVGWQFPPFAVSSITFTTRWNATDTREKIFAANYYPPWEADKYRDCPVVHKVTRHLWASEILLGYVRRCTDIP